MDQTDVYRVGSLRRNNSSMWRNRDDVFSQSSRDEDDEEALKWASLEKLPTYDRLRKGILTDYEGNKNSVDLKNIGLEERKHLFNKILKSAEEDNERFLLKLKERIDM